MSGFPDARSLSSLISNAKSILVSMQPVDDSVWFKDDPLPIVNCANGEVWLDKAGSLSCARTVRRVTSLLACRSASIPPRLAPIYDKTLREIFGRANDPDDMVRHWHELVGYGIQPRRDIPCFWAPDRSRRQRQVQALGNDSAPSRACCCLQWPCRQIPEGSLQSRLLGGKAAFYR